MRRVTQIIRLKPEYREQYEEYHRNLWPEIAANLKSVHIQNYSISWIDGLLFSYFEYTGDHYDEDMASLASFASNQKWRGIMNQMLSPYHPDSPGGGWKILEEVFYLE